ncbi:MULTISPECIES: hypothetical protein [Sphingobacterium]|uniref:hypothetical protein n=1 Tax=Sphingobacterium TaxID=28453 RepID=UPI0013DBD143|nr:MULTISPECIES: hypothetical protein [unclassified Sphingobacterium]
MIQKANINVTVLTRNVTLNLVDKEAGTYGHIIIQQDEVGGHFLLLGEGLEGDVPLYELAGKRTLIQWIALEDVIHVYSELSPNYDSSLPPNGGGTVTVDLSNYYTKTQSNDRYAPIIHNHTITSLDGADLYLHTHTNKEYLDTINQNLNTSASVVFDAVNANVGNINVVNATYVNATDKVTTKLLDATTSITSPLGLIDTIRTTEISSPTFVPGFTGEGFKLGNDANGDYVLELDRLSVRKDFSVYELVVNKIRGTNGSLWVSDAVEITEAVPEGSNYRCSIDTDSNTMTVPFLVDDIVRCQVFNGTGMKYYTALVTEVDFVNSTFVLQIIEGASTPSGKDNLVRIGSTSNISRQGALYLTSSDSGSPYLDVVDKVTSASLAGKMKVRLGKLDGIIDPNFGTLSGYGIYADNGYFRGRLQVVTGSGSNVYSKTETNSYVNNTAGGISQGYYNLSVQYTDSEVAQAIVDANQFTTDAINAINIGGRNLFLDSKKERTATRYIGLNVGDILTPHIGEDIVVSFYIKGTIADNSILVYPYQEIGVTISQHYSGNGITTDWTRIVIKTKVVDWGNPTFHNGVIGIYDVDNDNQIITIKEVKIELGDKVSEWTPAPEDIENALEVFRTETNTRFEVVETGLTSKVEQTDFNALNQVVSNQTTLIQQNADAIALRATKTEFDELTNTVGGIEGRVTSAEATLLIQADEIASKVTQTEVDVSIGNIKIGGRNFIRNSGNFKNKNFWITNGASHDVTNEVTYNGQNTLKIWGSDQGVFNAIVMRVKQDYDITVTANIFSSVDFDGDQYSGNAIIHIQCWTVETGETNVHQEQIYEANQKLFANKWNIVYKKFKTPVSTNDVFVRIYMYSIPPESIYIGDIKLEEGNKATTWSPAPEDIDERVTSNTTLISQKADRIELTALSTTVDTMGNTVASNTAQIEINSTAITSKVSQSDVDNSINNIKIGGRNLVRDSKSSRGYAFPIAPTVLLIPSNQYTFSFNVDSGTPNGSVFFNASTYGDGLNALGNNRYYTTFTYVVDDYSGYPIFPHIYGTTAVSYIKLEEGNKATTWSPAPEDIEQQFNDVNYRITNTETQIVQTNTNITLSASKTEAYLKQSLNIDYINGKNKWLFNKYDYPQASPIVAPKLEMIKNLTSTYSELTPDSNNLKLGDNWDSYIGHFRCMVFVDSNRTISFTCTHDDGMTAYVDGVINYESSNYVAGAVVNLVLKTGWNTIDMLYMEGAGGDGIFNISNPVMNQVNQMYSVTSSTTTQKVLEKNTYDGNFERGFDLWSESGGFNPSGGVSHPTCKIVPNIGVNGGNVWRTEAGGSWLYSKNPIPIINGHRYRVTVRYCVRQYSTVGSTTYCGFAQYYADGTAPNNIGLDYFVFSGQNLPADELNVWYTKTGEYIPGQSYNNIAYIKVAMGFNYGGGNAIIDCDSIILEDITQEFESKTYTNSQITVVNNAITAESTRINNLTGRMDTAEFKLQPDQINLTVKSQVDGVAIKNSWMQGKPLNTDPTFIEGFNGLSLYNNTGNNTNVVFTRLPKTDFGETFPTSSPYGLYYYYGGNGSTSPGLGGFYFSTQSRAKAKFIVRLVLAFEEGRNIFFNSNNAGDGYTQMWLTPQAGRGINNFTEYISIVECGSTGTFSSTNFFYFGDAPNVSCRIAFAGCYDITDYNNLPTIQQIESKFSMDANQISLFGKSIVMTGKVTFESLDSSTQNNLNNVNSTANTALGVANNAQNTVSNWTYAGTTEINGNQIRTGTITADKLVADTLIARQVKTSEANNRLTINETNDNTIKIRHNNGQTGIEMGLLGGEPRLIFYNANGQKIWEGGMGGIIYVNNIPESITSLNYCYISNHPMMLSFADKLQMCDNLKYSGDVSDDPTGTQIYVNTNTYAYQYSAGNNAQSGNNAQYNGLHNSNLKTSPWISNGWYTEGNVSIYSSPQYYFNIQIFYVENGQIVHSDYLYYNSQ